MFYKTNLNIWSTYYLCLFLYVERSLDFAYHANEDEIPCKWSCSFCLLADSRFKVAAGENSRHDNRFSSRSLSFCDRFWDVKCKQSQLIILMLTFNCDNDYYITVVADFVFHGHDKSWMMIYWTEPYSTWTTQNSKLRMGLVFLMVGRLFRRLLNIYLETISTRLDIFKYEVFRLYRTSKSIYVTCANYNTTLIRTFAQESGRTCHENGFFRVELLNRCSNCNQ